MSLIRRNWDPFNQLVTKDFWNDDFGFDSILRRMDNLERSLMPERTSSQLQFLHPKVDVKETETAFEITAEFPGLEKKDISIDLDEERRMLTLSGERKIENKEDNERYHYRERSYGSFKRSFKLPDDTKLDSVKASMQNGLLHIDIPKEVNTKEQPKTRNIQIGDSQAA